jgi:hypothetical protein
MKLFLVMESYQLDFIKEYEEKIEPVKIITFDPHIIDLVIQKGFRNFEYLQFDVELDLEIEREKILFEITSLEKSIENIIKRYYPEIPTVEGSNRQHLFNTALMLRTYQKLWDAVISAGFNFDQIVIVYVDHPSVSHYPSFSPAALLMERLEARKITFHRLPIASAIIREPQFPFVPKSSEALINYDAWVHLPTSFYDWEFFQNLVLKQTKSVLNFRSQNYDIEYSMFAQTELKKFTDVSLKGNQYDEEYVHEFKREMDLAFIDYFKSHFASEYFFSRQAKQLSSEIFGQISYYFYLIDTFGGCPPKTIFLSNHDCGLSYSFLAYASQMKVLVIYLPHAKIFNWLLPNSDAPVMAFSHPISNKAKTVGGKMLETIPLKFPYPKKKPSEMKGGLIVGLIINKFIGDGIAGRNITMYLEGIKKIIFACEALQIKVKIRQKPYCTSKYWLAKALNIEISKLEDNLQITIDEFARNVDLAICYATPSSAAISFLENSVPIIATKLVKDMPFEEQNMLNVDIVPILTLDETLIMINDLKAKNLRYEKFRKKQNINYQNHVSIADFVTFNFYDR